MRFGLPMRWITTFGMQPVGCRDGERSGRKGIANVQRPARLSINHRQIRPNFSWAQLPIHYLSRGSRVACRLGG